MTPSLHSRIQLTVEWTECEEPRSKRVKTQQSADKVMASVLWDARGIIFIDNFEKGQIKCKYYITLLEYVKNENTKDYKNI